MKTRITIPAFLISIFFPLILFSQSTISIRLGPNTGQDCEVVSEFYNMPLPSYPDIIAQSGTYGGCFLLQRPLFKFYLNDIPAGTRVARALLSLYGNPGSPNNLHDGANESYIRKVTSDWDQNTVTWETHPDYSTENQVLLPQSTSPTQDYLNIDVTELVRDMVRDPSTNFGFIMMNRIESFYRGLNFASSENSNVNKRPKLDITLNNVSIEPVSNDLPSDYKLSQNFPNPFNPVTNVKFDLPKASFTKVMITDQIGREITNLVNEKLESGSYQVQWDGSNYTSGVYFVRLESDNILITKKIMLIK